MMMLCEYCKNLDFREVFEDGHEHQPSYAKLVESAKSGCELCLLFMACADEEDQREIDSLDDPPERQLRCIGYPFKFQSWKWAWFQVSNCSWICAMSQDPFETGPLEIFTTEDSGLSEIRHGRILHPDSGSNECFQVALSWMRDCISNHPKCRTQKALELPTRVIDVRGPDEPSNPRIFVTEGAKGQWLALSHCWGKSVPLRATKDTLIMLQKDIAMDSLPMSFRDAIVITRRLGYRYLWIDSLCIIQDSPADWEIESGRMAYVYSNSVLTIAADAASDSSKGIFRSANTARGSHLLKYPCRIKGSTLDYVWIRGPGIALRRAESQLDKRAWTLQESLLSPRLLNYSAGQLRWSCRTLELQEKHFVGTDNTAVEHHLDSDFYSRRILFPPLLGQSNLPTRSKDPPQMRIPNHLMHEPDKTFPRREFIVSNEHAQSISILQNWYEILQIYTTRNLTYEADRLPAISGITKAIHGLTGFTYTAGIWEEDMLRGLSWRPSRTASFETGGVKGATAIVLSENYIAPSWSWASLDRPHLENLGQNMHQVTEPGDLEILNISIKYATDDPYHQILSGFLEIKSWCCSLDAFQLADDSHGDSYSWKRCLDAVVEAKAWDLKGQDFMLSSLTKVTAIPSIPGSPAPALIEHNLLVLKPIRGTENQFKRVGIMTIRESAFYRSPEIWTIKTLVIF